MMIGIVTQLQYYVMRASRRVETPFSSPARVNIISSCVTNPSSQDCVRSQCVRGRALRASARGMCESKSGEAKRSRKDGLYYLNEKLICNGCLDAPFMGGTIVLSLR